MDVNSLYRTACTGNIEAEKELFEALSVRFHLLVQQRVMNKEDREEVVQNSLTAIAEKYKAISIRTIFSAWAYGIFEKNLKNYYRSKRYHLSKMGRLIDKASASEPYNPDLVLKAGLIDCLKKVSRLNIRYARILNLFYQGYNGNEIGRKMKITRSNTYVLFSRARAMLKKCLEDKDLPA